MAGSHSAFYRSISLSLSLSLSLPPSLSPSRSAPGLSLLLLPPAPSISRGGCWCRCGWLVRRWCVLVLPPRRANEARRSPQVGAMGLSSPSPFLTFFCQAAMSEFKAQGATQALNANPSFTPSTLCCFDSHRSPLTYNLQGARDPWRIHVAVHTVWLKLIACRYPAPAP